MKQQKHLRVLMTTDTVGGVWRYSLRLAEALEKYNIEIHLATMGPLPDEEQQKEAAALSNVQLHESSYKLEWQDEPWDEIEQANMWLLYLEQQIKPHLVHLNNYVFGELPWDSPVLIVGHSCVLSWWENVKKESPPSYWETYRQKVGLGLHSADTVVAVSGMMKRQLDAHYGPLKNIEIIYNGIPTTEDNLEEKEDQIFAMGRSWDEGKNLQLLAQAADRLPFPVRIAGDGLDPNVESGNKLNKLGKLTPMQVANTLTRSSIFVSPSLYEPFGLAALEAADRGCVLVLSDIDTYHEIWQDAAVYFDPRDAESLIQVVHDLAKQPALMRSLREKAKSRSRDFDISSQASQYDNLYQLMIQKQGQKTTDSSYAH